MMLAAHAGVLIWVPATLLTIQFLAIVLGKVADTGHALGALPPMTKMRMELLAPGFGLSNTCWSHLGSEPTKQKYLSLSVLLFLQPPSFLFTYLFFTKEMNLLNKNASPKYIAVVYELF